MIGTIATAAQVLTYTIGATAGDRVLVRMSGTSGNVDPELRVYGPDGALVSGCSAYTNPGYVGPAEVLCSLSATGSHAILVGDYGGDDTGNYSLSVNSTTP
ncbi:MAG: hypothetical protein Q8O86_00335 [Dehalococcoidia bacterium]|nr:hypothetical protein [Dehalococcoidia bacterium]